MEPENLFPASDLDKARMIEATDDRGKEGGAFAVVRERDIT
jgi:hypothetical protein